MSPEDKLRDLIVSVGSITEMCKLFYDSYIAQGFTDSQAITLTSQILRSLFSPNSTGGAH